MVNVNEKMKLEDIWSSSERGALLQIRDVGYLCGPASENVSVIMW